jgi:hypothetical protein
MPAPIPEAIKSKVMDLWFFGYSRDYIASSSKISTGAVSNIAKEWEDKMGRDVVWGLKEIGVILKREGLSPAQCAIGFRFMKMFADQGVGGEAAEHFVSDIYKECLRVGITPSYIITHIEDLTKFSKEENVRLPEIKAYIYKKIAQKQKLVDEVGQLNNQIATLKEEKSELEKSRDIILEQNRRAEDEMKSYLICKQELEKHGISMNIDLPTFARTVKSIAGYGYDPKKVLEEFKDTQYHQDNLRALKIAIDEAQKYNEKLDSQNSSLLKSISLHSKKADIYNELENAGFGIKELKMLLDTIIDIARSNEINYWLAINRFFKDIETQYDNKLGFESEIEKLVREIKNLKEKREKNLENLRNQPFIGPIISGLLNLGLNETDIAQCAKIFPSLWKSSYSIKEVALGMIKTIEEMASSRARTTTDGKIIEILRWAIEKLSALDAS